MTYYKTLIKHTKQRKTIPILNTILVENGRAISTDIDFYISVPTDKKDGIYYGDSFNRGYESDIPICDYPTLDISSKKLNGEVYLNKKQIEALKWTMKASSTCITRNYLCGVYFDRENIVATDGHRLHSFKHKTSWVKPKTRKKCDKINIGAIIDNKACKAIINLIEEIKEETIKISFYDGYFSCDIGKCSIYGKLIDGTFPKWKKVVPNHTNKVPFNINIIKNIYGDFIDICKINNSKGFSVCLENGLAYNTDSIVIRKSWPIDLCLDIKIAFNIKFLINTCSGYLFYGHERDPIKIIDKRDGVEKMAVLMPMRC